jgi:hypothetical protein
MRTSADWIAMVWSLSYGLAREARGWDAGLWTRYLQRLDGGRLNI